MNLNNFEQEIDPIIVDRGVGYFRNGLVKELERVSQSKWTAVVSGSDLYNVEIKFKGREIVNWDCDCPYDWGPVCKHVVAVLFAIRKNWDSQQVIKSTQKTIVQRKPKEQQLKEILQKVSQDELVSFIEDYAYQHNRFFNEFLVHFADLVEYDDRSKYKQLIKNNKIINT